MTTDTNAPCARVTLKSGLVMLVDAQDAPLARRYAWRVNAGGYASRNAHGDDGRQHTELFHRTIVGAPRDAYVDHINWDKLDNRRCNLRLVTKSQNGQNRRAAQPSSQTGIRGVQKCRDRYRARLKVMGKEIWLGTYLSLEEASRAVAEGRARFMTHSAECEVQS